MIYQVMSRETIPDVSAAVGFTASHIPPAERRTIYALVQAVGGNIRYCIDGTTPTVTKGMRLTEDGTLEVWGAEAMQKFLCIANIANGSETVEVIFMGRGGLA